VNPKFVRLLVAFMLSAVVCLPGKANTAARTPKVYLVRGFMNVLSPGIDGFAYELEKKGIPHDITNHLLWRSIANEAIEDCRSGRAGSIVLIGHSLGAIAVVDIAKTLQEAGVRVALAVTLDPVASTEVPDNVHRLENYYLSTGIGTSVKRGDSFHGQLQNVDLGSKPQVDHVTLTTLPDIHQHIISEISAASGTPCR
jgi:hypothetical protein